ncbi:hypothetical protein NHF48_017520 [Sphingomonas sp. H160509]|uniref:hypothetical protein n=1 Tax=Sphingomonas sp. H160509 TaxID=2955313 RepID=UPI002097E786|nr:hypothetical protein [Sphingomonas sp. H160509]MDD1452312.1 hypothetical protein [Sphingomonas sp. H160509]
MTQPVSMQPVVTLRQRLAADGGSVPSEDLLRAVLPLMREVGALHARGLVAELGDEAVVDRDGELALGRPDGRPPQLNEAGIRAAQPRVSSALRVVGEYRVTTDIETGSQVDDLRAGSSGWGKAGCRPAGSGEPRIPNRLSELGGAGRPSRRADRYLLDRTDPCQPRVRARLQR